jgi:hypothetical protein
MKMVSPYLKRPLRSLAQARADLGRAPGKGHEWLPAPANAGLDLMASTACIAVVHRLEPCIERKAEAHPKAAA